MTTPNQNQVILLRGVNVNGITVKSVPLRASMESIAGVALPVKLGVNRPAGGW